MLCTFLESVIMYKYGINIKRKLGASYVYIELQYQMYICIWCRVPSSKAEYCTFLAWRDSVFIST